MSMLDMSSALTNPMLLSNFDVNRRVQTVDDFGTGSTAITPFTGLFGVIYPSDDNDLKLLPDLRVMGNTLTVITMFALYGEAEANGTDYQPDLVIWNGDSYLVRVVEDFSNYSAGFIKAICTSIDLVDQPPAG